MTEAEKERAAVVAWLRGKISYSRDDYGGGYDAALESAADAIERADHLKGTGDE